MSARPGRARSWLRLVALLALTLVISGCAAPRQWALHSLADSLAAAGQSDEEDLQLARDAAPVVLKASEALLQRVPDHLGLAEAVAGGFTQYAYAFVAFEAERLQTQDARAAQALQERAARLYARAHGHAMAALIHHQPQLRAALAGGPQADTRRVTLRPAEIGTAYWAAASWAAWISLSKHRPDVVADLPQAITLARWAHAQAPDHGQGALASLLGTLEAARPGGSAKAAEAWFEQALKAAGGDAPGVLVAMAESLAQPAGDRARFEALLQRALRAEGRPRDLQTQVMQERARWLLQSIDDLF
ncbi:MAG: hypothetical protein JNJ71_03345 [Rubrivivax sp.]|nr:hypothetical protein [Rubrivivax sp.]